MLETISLGLLILSVLIYGLRQIFADYDEGANDKSKKRTKFLFLDSTWLSGILWRMAVTHIMRTSSQHIFYSEELKIFFEIRIY